MDDAYHNSALLRLCVYEEAELDGGRYDQYYYGGIDNSNIKLRENKLEKMSMCMKSEQNRKANSTTEKSYIYVTLHNNATSFFLFIFLCSLLHSLFFLSLTAPHLCIKPNTHLNT